MVFTDDIQNYERKTADHDGIEKINKWIKEYKERKAQKTQIKYELAPIAWHPDRVIDWCFDEDEKRDLKVLWSK